MIYPKTPIAKKGQSRPRPAAYLGAIRPQSPENATPSASVTTVLILSNPINLL
jgi:hypothetical protein